MSRWVAFLAKLGLAFVSLAVESAVGQALSNELVRARFDRRGLSAIVDLATHRTFRFAADGFAVTIDGTTFSDATLGQPTRRATGVGVSYRWSSPPYRFEVSYRLEPGWRHVSKELTVTRAAGEFTVDSVTPLSLTLAETPAGHYVPRTQYRGPQADYGVALRFGDRAGLLAVVQNPFLGVEVAGPRVAVRYAPGMRWRASDGPFPADRALLAPYRLTGRTIPAAMTPEWQPPGAAEPQPGLDVAEVERFTDLVRNSLLYRPTNPINVFVGWCANDYQIDVATAEGRAEYRRLMDRAHDVGARYVLFAPSNSDLSRRESSVDDWSWEHVLWLGLGQQIRRDEWHLTTGEIPPSVREMLDHAKDRGLGLLAYVYPILPFAHNPEWLVPHQQDPGRKFANLANRALQDWLIDALLTFKRRTGIAGYAFDHAFLGLNGASVYAQWWGWRRVMEELRRRSPDIVIDGRQSYHQYGPWSWLAGSYPHPTADDEQPESFVPFPDLHFDRVSANRERYTAYRYRNYEFAPSEIVPGFATHQTSRSNDQGGMPEETTPRGIALTRFRARDWDYLGWRYSVLSSIAVGGWNNVINMIPARDSAEFAAFSREDTAWFRRWLEWTDRHKEYLRHTRTILGQPAIGKIDGTSAIVGDRGFLFLFNPNGRRLSAAVPLDATIGLAARGSLTITERYPMDGRLRGKPGAGWWRPGDTLTVELGGGAATVLELGPSGPRTEPTLFDAPGDARLAESVLELTGVRGEIGTTSTLTVVVPEGRPVRELRVNGGPVPFVARRPTVLEAQVRFAGDRFDAYQRVDRADPRFAGGPLEGAIRIPKRVFDQLAARRTAWPIPWTGEDYRTTWLVPERLLLFVQLAEPDPNWEARLTIDGRPVELKKAYSAVRAVPSTFVGFYADISLLDPDREYRWVLELPRLRPGQLQGVFVENVETEYTGRIVPAAGPAPAGPYPP